VTTPVAIIPRQRYTIVDHVGGMLTLHPGKPVTEKAVIELAIDQGVAFDLPQTIMLARGSGEVTLRGGTTLAVNACELVLKLDDALMKAVIADERITSLSIGGVRLTLEAAPQGSPSKSIRADRSAR